MKFIKNSVLVVVFMISTQSVEGMKRRRDTSQNNREHGKHKRQASKSIHQLICEGNDNDLQLLLNNLPHLLEKKDEHGKTPLRLAAQLGLTTIAELLLDKGANPNTPCPSRWTPLHYAVWFNRGNMVSHLLVKGAKVDATNHLGLTPLHYVLSGPVAQQLIDAGALIETAPTTGTTAGRTPLQIAQDAHRSEVLKVFQKVTDSSKTKKK